MHSLFAADTNAYDPGAKCKCYTGNRCPSYLARTYLVFRFLKVMTYEVASIEYWSSKLMSSKLGMGCPYDFFFEMITSTTDYLTRS
jgi:hypothetical protein